MLMIHLFCLLVSFVKKNVKLFLNHPYLMFIFLVDINFGCSSAK